MHSTPSRTLAYAQPVQLASLDQSGTIRLAGASGSPWAVAVPYAIGESFSSLRLPDVPEGTHRVMLRPTLDQSLNADVPRWSTSAWEAFDASCAALRDQLDAKGLTLCFRPHADDMLCDANACRAFLKRHKGEPFAIIADPTALLTPTMIPSAADHLVRIIETHAATPGVCAMILSDIKVVGDRVEAVPLGAGLLDAEMLVNLTREAWPSDRPVVLLEEDFAGQAERFAGEP